MDSILDPSWDVAVGWAGSLALLVGYFAVARQKRVGFLFSLLGNLLWLPPTIAIGRWDMAVMCVFFGAASAVGWFSWKRKT